jgi:hypothetical protein
MLTNCRIEENVANGVLTDSDCLISGSTISGNGGHGVVEASGDLSISNSTICGNAYYQVFDAYLDLGWNTMRGRYRNPYWDLGGNTVRLECSGAASDDSDSDSDSGGGRPDRPERPERPDRGERPVRNR